MNKKILTAVVLTLVVCLMASVGFATDSKTTTDIVTTTTTTTTSSSSSSSSSSTYTTETETVDETPVVTVVAATATSTQEFEAISTVVNSGAPVIEYFDVETQAEIIATLPTTVVAENLKMDEYIPVSITAGTTGAVKLTLTTTATYSVSQTVVPMVGVTINGKVVWKVVSYTIVDGQIILDIPEDLVELMGDSAIISILSAEEE